MAHGGGLDPHWFDYPTLLMYVIAPFEAWESHPSYLAARVVVIVLAVGSVAASWWLGSRAYGGAAGAVAAAAVAVETTHVAYSRMAVTDVPLTLAVAVALALMVSGRIELAGLAAGLAMSFKYPGVFLLVPLVVAGWRQWRRVAIGLVAAAAAFCATSPYFVVHLSSAVGDVLRVQRIARQGWLGFEHDHIAPIAFLDRLWNGLGPALLVCLLGLVRRARPAQEERPDPRVVRDRLLPRPLHARRALRPLRAPARAGARRAGGADASARAGDAAAARGAADLDDPRRRPSHPHGHAGGRAQLGRASRAPRDAACRRPVAAAVQRLRDRQARLAAPERGPPGPRPQPGPAAVRGRPLHRDHGSRRRPRARRAPGLPVRGPLLRPRAEAEARSSTWPRTRAT